MKNILKLAYFVFAFAVFMSYDVSAKDSAVNIFAASRPAPQRKIKHQNGTLYSLSDFKGQFIVAVFWSKNCGPCLKEMKDLNVFYKKALAENIRLILISPKSEWHSAIEQRLFLKKYGGSDLEFYTDNKGELAADFGIFTTPHTVLINEDGQEIGRIRGTAKWADKRVLAYIKSLTKQ